MGRTQSSHYPSQARPNRGAANSRGARGRGRGGSHQSSSSRNHSSSSADVKTTAAPMPSQKASAQKRKRTIHIKDGIAIRKSIQQLKAELRGAERLHTKKLASGDFAADDSLRKRSESKIAAIKAELANTQSLDKTKVEKFDVIYRSVKFFERVKASRKIEQLRKQIGLATAAGEEAKVKELQEELKRAELDLIYVLHYPAATKYVALWPTSSKDQEGSDESSSDERDDDANEKAEQPLLSEKAIKQRDQVREHLQSLIDHGLINVADTVRACVGDPGEEREKKKTKKKGDTEEDIKHKQIGHLLRGVGVAGLSDDEEEDSSVRRAEQAGASSSSENSGDSDGDDDDDDMDMDQDDFFMS